VVYKICDHCPVNAQQSKRPKGGVG
jgi:hypothetical protein